MIGFPGIIWDKTVDEKLMCIPNDFKQCKVPYSVDKIILNQLKQDFIKIPQDSKPTDETTS